MKFRLRHFIPTALFTATILGIAHRAHTQTVADTMGLIEYRTALDQLSTGKPQNARLLLESSQSRGEMAPESAVLLAYLEERAGDSPRARAALEGSSAPTDFVAAYLSHLGAPLPVNAPPRPSTARTAGSAVLPVSDARISRLEKQLWQLVNDERVNKGLRALDWDDHMADVARAHSAEMRDLKYFAHESPTPSLREPLDRYVAGFGTTPRIVAENIYRAWGGRSFLNEADIKDAHKALMNSPGHRANILLDGVTRIGIGITSNSTGDIWVTQMFSRN